MLMKIKPNIIKIGHIFNFNLAILLNLIENQPDIDKLYLYAKDLNESKYNI